MEFIKKHFLFDEDFIRPDDICVPCSRGYV